MVNENRINNYVVIIAILCSFSVAFTSNAVSIALPEIAVDFGISNIMQNWIVNLYLLLIAAASVPAGKLCGKYGLNVTLKIGIIIYIIGAIMSGFSPDINFMLVSRFIQALGSTVLFVNVLSIITAQIPPSSRGHAIGLNVTGVYLGLTLSPTISGILVQNISWRSIFLITIPLTVIALVLLYLINNEWKIDESLPIDIKGSILFVIGIMILIYGFTILNEVTGMILTVIGLIILILFGIYESKLDNPVYNVRLFKNKVYTSANLASMISYFATFVITYVLNYHFQYLNGMDPQTAGILLIVTPLLMAIVSPIAGHLSDKVKPQILTTSGMALVSVALIMLCFLDENTSLMFIIVSMFIQGIGFGLFSSPSNNIIMGSVEKKDIPTASSSISTVRNVGQSFSLGLLTLIFAVVMGNVTITPSSYPLLVQSNHITILISTVLCIIAALLSTIGIKD